MTQAYSDPSREDDAYALPDIEVFEADDYPAEDGEEALAPGWYWWFCFPGCLPDSEPCGPFETEEEALADALADAKEAECARCDGTGRLGTCSPLCFGEDHSVTCELYGCEECAHRAIDAREGCE